MWDGVYIVVNIFWRILWKAKTNYAVVKNANAVMDVKRENHATATVIVMNNRVFM